MTKYLILISNSVLSNVIYVLKKNGIIWLILIMLYQFHFKPLILAFGSHCHIIDKDGWCCGPFDARAIERSKNLEGRKVIEYHLMKQVLHLNLPKSDGAIQGPLITDGRNSCKWTGPTVGLSKSFIRVKISGQNNFLVVEIIFCYTLKPSR